MVYFCFPKGQPFMNSRVAPAILFSFFIAFTLGCGSGGSTPAGSQGSVGFNPTSLTFASTTVGTSAGAQSLTFTNGTLTITK